jgi:hypothetical protein
MNTSIAGSPEKPSARNSLLATQLAVASGQCRIA